MHKILKLSDGQQMKYTYIKFPLNWNCDLQIVSEMVSSSGRLGNGLLSELFGEWVAISTLSSEQNGRHFPGDIFISIFLKQIEDGFKFY